MGGRGLQEVETIVVRSGDYFSSPSALVQTASDDWETPLQPTARPTRDVLKKIVDVYFTQFPSGACDFASDCKRLESGFLPGGCALGLTCSGSGGQGRSAMTPRLHVLDVEAGIAVIELARTTTALQWHAYPIGSVSWTAYDDSCWCNPESVINTHWYAPYCLYGAPWYEGSSLVCNYNEAEYYNWDFVFGSLVTYVAQAVEACWRNDAYFE